MAQTLKGSYLGKLPLWSTDPLYHCRDFRYGPKRRSRKISISAERRGRADRKTNQRLSKGMYGSTCADMLVDVMGECLSSIKHVVGVRSVFPGKEIARRIAVKITPSCCLSEKWRIINLLDDIWMILPEVESLGSWRKAAVNSYPGFSSGRPRGTTPADDRYIVLQARRNRRHNSKSPHTTQARFTVARRLHGGALFASMPYESRFSLSSDSHRILSESGEAAIIPRTSQKGQVWRSRCSRLGGIMLGSRTDLHIFDAGSVNGTRYCNEILLPYVRLFRGAMGLQFLFHGRQCTMSSHSSCRTALRGEDIERMDWPARARISIPSSIWGFLSRRLAARTLSPVTIRASIGAARRMGSNASTTY
ncbi:transposable element Tcb1 transposase [Trichonephila clavipes]|nr:transposable element Tcb1 transposase [Trichonephila clavipes]